MDDDGPFNEKRRARSPSFIVSNEFEKGWLENSKLVLSELSRLEERSTQIQRQISSLEVKIAKIEVKMAFVSIVWATIIVAVLEFFIKAK